MDELALLQHIPLFADMPKEQLAQLTRALERRVYRKGQLILRQGDYGESLFVIVSGKVRIYTLSPEGHEVSVFICDEGDFFGELALLTGMPRSANVQAMRRTEVLVLQRQAFRHYLLSNPATALRIIETLSRRLRSTTESVEELVSLNVNQRVARKLLELAERYGIRQANGVMIDLDLSQEAVASLVGTTRESANRALGGLRERGIVHIERVRITITDPAELEKLAS